MEKTILHHFRIPPGDMVPRRALEGLLTVVLLLLLNAGVYAEGAPLPASPEVGDDCPAQSVCSFSDIDTYIYYGVIDRPDEAISGITLSPVSSNDHRVEAKVPQRALACTYLYSILREPWDAQRPAGLMC